MTPYLGPNPELVIRQIRSRDAEWFAHSELVAFYAANVLNRLHVHEGNVRELLAALLFQRIASGFEACLVLAERGMHTQALMQRRSMLEALFVLGAIWQRPVLADSFLAADARRVLQIYKKIKRLPIEIKTALEPELPESALDRKIAELEADGPTAKPPTALEYATAADLLNYYLTDYAFLSESVHHVAKDLEQSIALDEDGEVNGLYWGPEKEPPVEVLSGAVNYVLMAGTAAERLFGIEPSEEGRKLRERTNELIERSENS